MDMHSLPFKPRHLTLAIATALLTTQPAARALANSEWNCQSVPSGKWSCAPTPTNRLLAAAIPEKNVVQKQSEKTTISSNRQAPSVVATPSGASLTAILDWRPLAELTEPQKAAEPFYSCGAYIEPARPGKNFKGDINSAPIVAEANESTYDKESVATLKGNVKVRQGSRQLQSDQAFMDRNRNYGEFEGNVRFREAGVLLVGDRGDLQLDSGRATLENTSYVMHEQKVRGEAAQVVRHEDSTLELSDATYTSCPPGENSWELSGDNVTLDLDSGQGLAKDAVIRVKGLPVFYTPYLSFPIDDRRKSGFLYPTMGQNSDNGLDFSVPYYWNIAPNYDATITPRYMSKRGLLVENEFRYLLGNSHGEIGLAGLLNKDDLHKDNPYFDENRWLINLRHQTLITSRWSAEIDYARASDKNYLEDFKSNLNLTNQSPLNQRIGTHYQGGDLNHSWQIRLDAHQYQNMSRTSDDPYNRLPQLALTGTWHATDSLDLNYLAGYTKFSRDKNWDYINETLVDAPNNIYQSNYGEGYGIKRANGERMVLETGASYSMEWSYAFITPSVKIQHVQYQLSDLNKDDVIADLGTSYENSFNRGDYTETPKTTVPTVSIDSGLYFDRAIQFGETSFTHTLEPRMKYLYSPYVEGQEINPIFDTALLGFNYNSLWRDSRFSGYDRLGDANQLSLGVTSRLLEEDGFERARFDVGQILYFSDRQLWISPTAGTRPGDVENWNEKLNDAEKMLLSEMQNRTSPLATELVYNINWAMSIRQDLMWDTNENEIDDYGLYYTYKPDSRRVLNIGYRYRDQVDRYVKNEQNENIDDPNNPGGYLTAENQLRQTDISFAWPVYNRWSAMGRWQYDITNKRNLEIMSGLEYNSCCYQVRLLWRNWIEDGSNIDHPDTKSGVFLQFVLRGLGNIATGPAKEYLEGIKGYTADEK